MSERWALYFAPEDGTALARFGWDWLGRVPSRPDYLDLPAERARLVAKCRLYGFHATLKAPFRLSDGSDPGQLAEAVALFAATRRPIALAPLELSDRHGFLALRPAGRPAELHALADDCVRAFDRYRAPPGQAEVERRLAAGLNPAQRDNLARWGYPHVFGEFHFHMTLSDGLDAAGCEAWRHPVAEAAARALAEPLDIRSLCLFHQPAPAAPFVLARRFPLGG